MQNARKVKVFFTVALFVIAMIACFLAVSWILSHVWLLLVLGAVSVVGYYTLRRAALSGGMRTLL